jgi:UDP-2,3-diacylglucosamine pyrophosphatase LpxH
MYFIGDTHGIRPIFTIVDKHKLENQNLIHVGDLGLGFQEIRRDIHDLLVLDEMLGETGNTLYVIRGNHDNSIFWNRKLGLWLPKFQNIHLQEDYTVRNIEDKKILFVGGAISIDRTIRKDEHPPTWWKGEEFEFDLVKLVDIEQKYDTIDIVVTHTAPTYAFPRGSATIVDHYCSLDPSLRTDLEWERDFLSKLHEFLMKKYKLSHWIYGHFHGTKKEMVSGTEFKLLNINELYEVI